MKDGPTKHDLCGCQTVHLKITLDVSLIINSFSFNRLRSCFRNWWYDNFKEWQGAHATSWMKSHEKELTKLPNNCYGYKLFPLAKVTSMFLNIITTCRCADRHWTLRLFLFHVNRPRKCRDISHKPKLKKTIVAMIIYSCPQPSDRSRNLGDQGEFS